MRVIAILLVLPTLFLGCESAGKKTAYGAGIGAAAGAAAGAIIGHQSGNRGKGALIGAALGAGAGSLIGNRLDKQAKELEKIAETRRTEDGIVTKLKGDITFKSGSTAVNSMAQGNIKKITSIVKKYPENVITIVGHTDSTGSDVKNQVLSKRRADSVRAIMVSQGFPAQNVTAVGMGENEPIGNNKTKSGRAQNRRVEIKITADESKLK